MHFIRAALILSTLIVSGLAEAATVRFVPHIRMNYECTVATPRRCQTEDLMGSTVVAEVKDGFGSWNFTHDLGEAGYWLTVSIYEDDPGVFGIFVQGNVIDNTQTSRLIWAYFRTELRSGESFSNISGMTMPLVIKDLQYDMAFSISNFIVEP